MSTSLDAHMKKIAAFNAKLAKQGKSKTELAREKNLDPHEVIRFLNGYGRGTRGKSHKIATALGLSI